MYLSTYDEKSIICLLECKKNLLLISFGISGLLPENKQLISNYYQYCFKTGKQDNPLKTIQRHIKSSYNKFSLLLPS